MRYLLVPTLACSVLSGISAADKAFVGPRAHGMAGANVASVNDATAQFYNPGALGFFRGSVGYVGEGDEKELSTSDNHRLAQRDFDMSIDGSIGYRVTGDMGDYLTDLADVDIVALGNLNAGSGITQSELNDVINVLNIFTDISDKKNSFVINGSVGANVRVKNFAVGVRGFGNFLARVSEVDTTNLGISFNNMGEFNTALENLETIDNILPGNFASYTPTHISPALQSNLATAGFSTNAIDILDYQIGQGISGGAFSQSDVDDITGLLETVGDTISGALSGGDLDSNTTTVQMTGIGYVEVPVSYGHAIDEHLSIGVSAKFMIGRVYGTNILVFDDENDEIISNIDSNYNDSESFSVDIGLMYRINNFQIGLSGSNLTSPEFEGFTDSNGNTYDDITIEPQVTAGLAWIPHATMTVEVDLDLLAADNGLNGYETQYLSVGAEWNFFHVLALRAGAYQNIAEDEVGPVLTGGLGLNMALVRLDLGVAFSPEMVEVDGDEIPEEASASIGLMIKF